MEFHPDKNNTSKASEAFKHVNKAYKCLIDDNKREYYDSTGKEEEVIINMEHIFTKDTLIIVFLSVLHGTVFSPGHNLYSFFSPSTQIFGSYNKILKYVPSFLLIFLMFSSLYMQLTQPSTQDPTAIYKKLKIPLKPQPDLRILHNSRRIQKIPQPRPRKPMERLRKLRILEKLFFAMGE